MVNIFGTNNLDNLTSLPYSADSIWGFGGNDVLRGWSGNDWVFGGAGDDQVYGGSESDYVYGNEGNDYIVGGTGADNLYGGIGNDTLTGDDPWNGTFFDGRDRLTGGEGADQFRFDVFGATRSWQPTDVITQFVEGQDSIFLGGASQSTVRVVHDGAYGVYIMNSLGYNIHVEHMANGDGAFTMSQGLDGLYLV